MSMGLKKSARFSRSAVEKVRLWRCLSAADKEERLRLVRRRVTRTKMRMPVVFIRRRKEERLRRVSRRNEQARFGRAAGTIRRARFLQKDWFRRERSQFGKSPHVTPQAV
jgi:hypothetical protein